MKSLILKDLYNIGRNARSMLLVLAVLAIVFLPTSRVEGYIYISAILCSMMIVTTFMFDDASKWPRYAMILPISRKDLVGGKFVVLTIFCLIGSLFGLAAALIGGFALKKVVFDLSGIGELLFSALISWAAAMVFGSMSIPLVFKLGAEKGRVLLLISFLVPAAICFGAYRLLVLLGMEITDSAVFLLLCGSPVIALVWCCLMYRISCRIFEKQELS